MTPDIMQCNRELLVTTNRQEEKRPQFKPRQPGEKEINDEEPISGDAKEGYMAKGLGHGKEMWGAKNCAQELGKYWQKKNGKYSCPQHNAHQNSH